MARIITVANGKGGAGKSTLSLILAEYLATQKLKIGLCDTDPQGTSSGVELPGVELVDLQQVGRTDHDFIVIDTPPFRVSELDAIFKQTDFCLVPVQPSGVDARAAASIIQELRESGVKFGIVLNRVKPGTSLTDSVRESLEGAGVPVLANEIRDRVAYQRAAIHGSLIELGDQKAVLEVANLTAEIFRMMLA